MNKSILVERDGFEYTSPQSELYKTPLSLKRPYSRKVESCVTTSIGVL